MSDIDPQSGIHNLINVLDVKLTHLVSLNFLLNSILLSF